MADLAFELHPGQLAILNSPALYKVVAAGRRFGKSYLAAVMCIIEALRDTNDRGHRLDVDAEVIYFAPTFDQAKGVFWPLLKMLADPVTAGAHENTGVLTLTNGVRIRLKGMDSPDRARGFKLRFAVLDEYADMPAGVWEAIVQPALLDLEGGALFIGTPKGKNHFYELHTKALGTLPGADGLLEWESFKFRSEDNPTLNKKAILRMIGGDNYSSDIARQELEADFLAGASNMISPDWWRFTKKEPLDGYFIVVADLAGFTMDRLKKEKVKRDESAIAAVKLCRQGWWVKTIVHGRWDTRETALRLLKVAMDCDASAIGIERGISMAAVLPYMDDLMAQYRRFYRIEVLTHGNQHKEDRITWAIQGRAEKGRIWLNCEPDLRPHERPVWVQELITEAADFPSKNTPDNKIDALSYAAQIGATVYTDYRPDAHDQWAPLDADAGF